MYTKSNYGQKQRFFWYSRGPFMSYIWSCVLRERETMFLGPCQKKWNGCQPLDFCRSAMGVFIICKLYFSAYLLVNHYYNLSNYYVVGGVERRAWEQRETSDTDNISFLSSESNWWVYCTTAFLWIGGWKFFEIREFVTSLWHKRILSICPILHS